MLASCYVWKVVLFSTKKNRFKKKSLLSCLVWAFLSTLFHSQFWVDSHWDLQHAQRSPSMHAVTFYSMFCQPAGVTHLSSAFVCVFISGIPRVELLGLLAMDWNKNIFQGRIRDNKNHDNSTNSVFITFASRLVINVQIIMTQLNILFINILQWKVS